MQTTVSGKSVRIIDGREGGRYLKKENKISSWSFGVWRDEFSR